MTDFKERISGLSPKRIALLAVELQKKLERAESRKSEPVAVVGLGCRFPGGANSAHDYWELLRNGVDCIQEVPGNRWDVDALHDPDPHTHGKMVTRGGGFIEDVDMFDAAFFGITPREAVSLDPRHRILLEVAWEALEHAGQAPDGLFDSKTGVFVGACGSDYFQLLIEERQKTLDAYLVSGIASSMAAGRIAYALGLHGPALCVDTACSSSLVAVHLACQSLRSGECDMALAGGTTLILVPEVSIGLSNAEMLSPDSRCKTFDDSADGIVRGEGCGAIVLKRLADAESNGDRILAVIQGSAVNQDGRSGGITAPNGPSQEAAIRDALRQSGVHPEDVDYVETHGTGTPLGDPIEVRALNAVLGPGRQEDNPVQIGSVKTNFGHLEASAGIAGLIKAVLALDNETIPPHLHLDKLSSHIEWDSMCVTVPTELTPWPRSEKRRIAGVSAFGFSGTNAHVVLAEAPTAAERTDTCDRSAHVLTASARTPAALDELVTRYAQDLTEHPDRPIADTCYTANAGRAGLEERIAVVGASHNEICEQFCELRDGESGGQVIRGRAAPKAPDVAFLFSGNCSPDSAAAEQLYSSERRVRDDIDRCAEVLMPLLGDTVRLVLCPWSSKSAAESNDLRFVQAATFAWQYALARLWQSLGISPSVALGYDVGEYVSACLAGVFQLEDALGLVVRRAELALETQGDSAVAAVFADLDVVTGQIDSGSDNLRISAINGPAHTVISGPAGELEELCAQIDAQEIKTTRLPATAMALSGASLDEFERHVEGVTRGKPSFGLVSCVTGDLVGPRELMSTAYWRRHASERIDFRSAMRRLAEGGHRVYLEPGPEAVLLPLGRSVVQAQDSAWLPTLQKSRDGWTRLLQSLAELYVRGASVDWHALDEGRSRRVVTLPTYPFEHKRYWVERTSPATAPVAREKWRDWLYEFRWRASGSSARDGSDLNAPAEVARLASTNIDALADEHGIDVYREFGPQLDALCAAYIMQALDNIGWRPTADGAAFTAAELREQLGVLQKHERLFARMLEILGEDGVLQAHGDGWKYVDRGAGQDAAVFAAELLEQFPAGGAELDVTINCGRSLDEVLVGKADPMQLLFPQGSLAPTERLYQESAGLRLFNSLVREAVAAACAKIGPHRKIRILELGAGTGSATSYVLPVLHPEQTEYVFTDVSNAFLHAASEKFSEYRFVDYKIFDAGVSPLDQGYSEHEFDIVIAANVIHATPDLRQTIDHIKQVLAPEGLVILLEGTVPQRFGDLTVGLTPGWWSFTDVELRPSYALLSAPQWCDLFEDTGFSSVATIPGGDHPRGGAVNQQAVIVARGPAVEVADDCVEDPGNWVVFCDEGGVGDALADAVIGRGGSCIRVRKGDSFASVGDDDFVIDTSGPDDFQQLFSTLSDERQLELKGAVHCWAMDASLSADATLDEIDAVEQDALSSALYLAQALATGSASKMPRLALLTRRSQATTNGEQCPGFAQAGLWGFARVVELEHPELRCITVDIDTGPKELVVTDVLDRCLLADSDENQLALRDRQLLALRATSSPGASTERGSGLKLVPDGVYVVTGGLTGLGLLVAEWLAERGARHLVLAGRRPPNANAQEAINALTATGVSVSTVQADVAADDCNERLDAILSETGVPLRGVVHCAGSLDDGVLVQQDWSRFEKVMAAKVRGSWNLHRLCESRPVDFFVLFSTGASFIGSPGQSNHAAANAFMDALAFFRRGLGLPALTINWGPWSEIGAAVRTGVADRAVTSGMDNISPRQGLSALDHLMQGEAATQVAVLPAGAARLVEHHARGQSNPVFRELMQAADRVTVADDEAAENLEQTSELEAALERASPKSRRAILLRNVQQAARKVMGLGAGERIDAQRPLIDLGLDSLMAVELRNTIGGIVNRKLPATLLFNYPSIGELVDHLLDDVLALGTADGGEPQDDAAQQEQAKRDEELNQLGEDELADLLATKLSDLDHAS